MRQTQFFSQGLGKKRSLVVPPSLVPARNEGVLAPLRPLPEDLLRRSPLHPAGRQTTPRAARSARTLGAKLPSHWHFHTWQSSGLCQKRTSCPGKRDRTRVAPAPVSIPAAAARRPRIWYPAHLQMTKGTPRKGERGWRSSKDCCKCGTRKGKPR